MGEEPVVPLGRRAFVGRVAGLAAAALAAPLRLLSARDPAEAAPTTLTRVDALPTTLTRTWLGPTYWANRLQDWRLAAGRLECLAGGAEDAGRTVAVLTREVVPGPASGSLSVRTGTVAGGPGFSGFLVGAGAGLLDHRAAALVQGASGTGGGLFCVYTSDGIAAFCEHTDEADQFAYARLPARDTSPQPRVARSTGEDLELRLDIAPTADGSFSLTLTVTDMVTGRVRASAVRSGVADAQLRGGIALVSSPRPGAGGGRYWHKQLRTGGAKIAARPDRAVGPVLGCLYSVNGPVLKLTAQFFPLGSGEPATADLEVRDAGGWRRVATAAIGAGHAALFRVEGWDRSVARDYRVVHARGTARESRYAGTIARDPAGGLTIGVLSCMIHANRLLDRASSGAPRIPGERRAGLYTGRNLYFPYARLLANLSRQRPDLLVALGDQFYEHRPTRYVGGGAPTLDFLGRYYLWLWSVAGLTRRTPSIVLVDDHDVLQPNLWGHEGRPAPGGKANLGGYVRDAAMVNLIQRVQCGHNPDPYDATPVRQGITVNYGAFVYGGVSFAMLEDRKFKTGDGDGRDASGTPFPQSALELLGERQEQFLQAWAANGSRRPRICLTQTLFANLATTPAGLPKVDRDSNGYPPGGRRRAVRLLKQARALIVSGDQHTASLVRHGVDGADDGPVQFGGPAAGAAWQRWFEPKGTLPDRGAHPHTGLYTDPFGNRLRVLAVANPRVSFARYRSYYPDGGQDLADPGLKREGYGIVRVDHAAQRFVLECWPGDVDPTRDGAAQYAGWPYVLPFSQA